MTARFDVIGFDADDTLWRSEDSFDVAERRFEELVGPYTPEGIDAVAALRATERANLSISGYGVKAFTLSMIECAVTITHGEVPARVVGQLVELGHEMLTEPVQLLPDVPEVLADVGRDHRLLLITKGDLVHQSRKITTSGLEHHFEYHEILLEKDPASYARILRHVGVEPARFVMVGNSVRSDILPVIELGGHGVHVPYHLTWAHEHVEHHDAEFVELSSLALLPAWLRDVEAAPGSRSATVR